MTSEPSQIPSGLHPYRRWRRCGARGGLRDGARARAENRLGLKWTHAVVLLILGFWGITTTRTRTTTTRTRRRRSLWSCCFVQGLEDCFRPQIQRGRRGSHVTHAQMQLLRVGDPNKAGTPAYHVRTSGGADGIFGHGTERAVVAYQQIVFPKDPSEWDGIVGTETWARLGCNSGDIPVTTAPPPSPPSPPRPPSPPSPPSPSPPSPPATRTAPTFAGSESNYCTAIVYNSQTRKALLHLPHDFPPKKRAAKVVWTTEAGKTKTTRARRKTIVTLNKPSMTVSVEIQVRYKRPKETWQCTSTGVVDDTHYRCNWKQIRPVLSNDDDLVIPQGCRDASLVNCGVSGDMQQQQRAVTCNDCADRKNWDCISYDCSWMTVTSLCRDALSDNVRTASVHLWHDFGMQNVAWWFQQLTIEAASDATYFATSGHAYGYGGFQVVEENPLLGRFIFSIWDQGGCDRDFETCDEELVAQTVACGTGVVCQDFGGEGTGRKSTLDSTVMPVAGVTYSFVTQAVPVGNNRVEYTGYTYSDMSGWQLLSRIQVSRGTLDWAIHSPYSFVEQWLPVTALQDRKGLFGPSFVRSSSDGDSFVQIPSSTFSHGTGENHERVNAWLDESRGAVGLGTGGSIRQKVFRDSTFFYPPVSTRPAALSDFIPKIPCLNDATNTASIEACLA